MNNKLYDNIQKINSATNNIINNYEENNTTNIVLVIVESMGAFSNTKDNDTFFNIFKTTEITNLYHVKTGEIPFYGSTVSAEMKELCGIKLYTANPDITQIPPCLPSILKEKYRTIAIHPFSGFFFNRIKWYNTIGFDEIYFKDDLLEVMGSKQKLCGDMFKGVCERDVAEFVKNKIILKENEEHLTFVYWLTLVSHLPVTHVKDQDKLNRCAKFPIMQQKMDACHQLSHVLDTLEYVKDIALKVPNTRFIITGDHSPPYFDLDLRNLYSNKNVPFIELIPY